MKKISFVLTVVWLTLSLTAYGGDPSAPSKQTPSPVADTPSLSASSPSSKGKNEGADEEPAGERESLSLAEPETPVPVPTGFIREQVLRWILSHEKSS